MATARRTSRTRCSPGWLLPASWRSSTVPRSPACACAATGWQPVFITLTAENDAGVLRAGAALYLKSHSYGEYVFDWAWADAWAV